jgi:hypothetical protein
MVLRTFLFLLMIAVSVSGMAQNGEQIFSKSFHADGKNHLQLYLPGPVDLKVWNEASIRVEIGVTLPGGSPSLVKELANAGRYNMVSTTQNDLLRIDAPNAQKQIRLKGQPAQETYRFIVYLPSTMEVDILPVNQLAAARVPQN